MITDQNFAEEVLASPLPVLVDFWAPWCGPCRMMTPVIDALQEELEGRVRVHKLNVDENPMTASQYGVRSIPILMIFKDGHLLDTKAGVLSKEQVKSWVEQKI